MRNLLLDRVIVPRSLGPGRMPMPRTLAQTKVGGWWDDLWIGGDSVVNKVEHVNTAADILDKDFSNWAMKKAGGKSMSKDFGPPIGVVTIPGLASADDQALLLAWKDWFSGWKKFYVKTKTNYWDWNPSETFHEAEKYEVELEKWRAKLGSAGGTVSAPPLTKDEETSKKSAGIPWVTIAVVGTIGVVSYLGVQYYLTRRAASAATPSTA